MGRQRLRLDHKLEEGAKVRGGVVRAAAAEGMLELRAATEETELKSEALRLFARKLRQKCKCQET